MENTKYTPTPWMIEPGRPDIIRGPAEPYGRGFTQRVAEMLGDSQAYNAAFIVTAVNCHADLLAALKTFVDHCPMCAMGDASVECMNDDCYQAREAIKKATEIK